MLTTPAFSYWVLRVPYKTDHNERIVQREVLQGWLPHPQPLPQLARAL